MRLIAMLAVTVIIGCRDSTAPLPEIALRGQWEEVRAPGAPLSYGVSLTLAVQRQTATGAGGWREEAGPFGDIAVTGSIDGDHITLDLIYTYYPGIGGGVAHHDVFSGGLISASDLVGLKSVDGQPPAAEAFKREITIPE